MRTARAPAFKFRLYVVGDTQNSSQAINNFAAFCATHLTNRHETEVVDVLREPRRALQDQVVMTPTLIKLSPPPTRRVVGTLSQSEPLLAALGLRDEGT